MRDESPHGRFFDKMREIFYVGRISRKSVFFGLVEKMAPTNFLIF